MASVASTQWSPPRYADDYYYDRPGVSDAPLSFRDSIAQAKDELKHFFARDRPVTDSIANIQDYYEGVKGRNTRDLRPRRQLRRPCKVLPDPEPGLVNPLLVEPTHVYHPLMPNEEFYGKFAPPVKIDKQGPVDQGYPGRPGLAPPSRYTAPLAANYRRNKYNEPLPPPPAYANGNDLNHPLVHSNFNRPLPMAVANYAAKPNTPPAVNNNNLPANSIQAIPPQKEIVQVPLFMTQKETVFLAPPTPLPTTFFGNGNEDELDPYHQQLPPTPTATEKTGFFANFGNWIAPTNPPQPTATVDSAALLSSISALKASMSAQSAAASSASVMAYFSSVAASLSAREAALSAQVTPTARPNGDGGAFYNDRFSGRFASAPFHGSSNQLNAPFHGNNQLNDPFNGPVDQYNNGPMSNNPFPNPYNNGPINNNNQLINRYNSGPYADSQANDRNYYNDGPINDSYNAPRPPSDRQNNKKKRGGLFGRFRR